MTKEHNTDSKYKTISIEKEIYKLVKEKQSELMVKNDGNYVELSYIAGSAVLLGIDKVDLPEEI